MAHIYLVPISFPADELNKLAISITVTLHAEVSFMPYSGHVEKAFDRNRSQYSSIVLLSQLLEQIPTGDGKILGVTEFDLFTPVLTYIFGEAQLGGNAAVVSSCRLKNSFYGLSEDPELARQRLVKVAVHELGHTFDLVHCPYYTCVMCASTSVEEVDMKSSVFCATCMAAINRKIRA